MGKEVRETIEQVDADNVALRALIPDMVKAFGGLARAAQITRAAPLLALVLVFAQAPSAAEARPHAKEGLTSAQRGRLVAELRCAGCHAIDPGRESPRPRAPGFATREMRHTAGESRLRDLTRRGHYDMPPMTLTDAEVADLLAYIENLGNRE